MHLRTDEHCLRPADDGFSSAFAVPKTRIPKFRVIVFLAWLYVYFYTVL